MSETERAEKCKAKSAETPIIYPSRAVEHAAELAKDFAQVYNHIRKSHGGHEKLPKDFKENMKKGVERSVAKGVSKGVCPNFSSNKDKTTFQVLIFNRICDLFSTTIPQEMFDALDESFRHLVPKIQALEFASQQLNQHPVDAIIGTGADQDADNLLNDQTARPSNGNEIADNMDDEISDDKKIMREQPAIRLQGSVDFSPDRSDLKSGEESETDSDVEIGNDTDNHFEMGKENQDKPAAMVSQDPSVFTITLGVPLSADDHRFRIEFNDRRIVDGLGRMPSGETWQLIHDAIQHDPDIPNRPSSLPRITHVHQQNEGSLAFKMRTEEDLKTLSTNVQWVRAFRNTIAVGIKTYKVVLEFVKIQTMRTEDYRDRASLIDKLRAENCKSIPSLNHIGAIRDVMMLEGPAFKRQRDDYADYLLVFGSREAANAALEMGLLFHNRKRSCVIYAPGTEWHQPCSNCQRHHHTTKDCHSTALCGKCGDDHVTQSCSSATIKCANCQGLHVASSRECPKWSKTERRAHRAYRFPAEESPQIPVQAEKTAPATLSPPDLPLPPSQKSQETIKSSPELVSTLPNPSPNASPKALGPATNTSPATVKIQNQNTSIDKTTQTTAPSALLQTIDEFRAFVAARENNHQESRKRKGCEYVMTGALQADDHDGKRVKREEEGPVWPIGQEDYQPPSLRLHQSNR